MGFWLRQMDKKIFINTGKHRFYISNENISDLLFVQFPDLKNKPVFFDDSDEGKVTLLPQTKKILEMIANKLPSTKAVNNNANYELLIADKNEEKDTFLKKIESMKGDIVRVIFPCDNAIIASCGKKSDMIFLAEEKFIKANNISYNTALAIRKADTAAPSDDGCISYSIISDNRIMIKECLLFRNIALYNDPVEISEIELEGSKAIHTELNELDTVFSLMTDHISSYGFSDFDQIPFKVAGFEYRSRKNETVKTISVGNEPGEVYVRAIKMGFSALLDGELNTSCTKNVMAQTTLDILLTGVLPLMFEKIGELSPELLTEEKVDLKEIDDISARLLFDSDNRTSGNEISVDIICINGSSLKKGVLCSAPDVLLDCYGTNKEEIIRSLLRTFYGSNIQNHGSFRTEIGNDTNIHGEEEKKMSDDIISDIRKVMQYLPDINLKIKGWKYNNLLAKARMKCFAITISKG